MKYDYKSPDTTIIMIETEQCVLNGSNAPGLDPGTDLDELFED